MLKISSLLIYQFLFEPLQYFLIETQYLPSFYLGRFISILIIFALIYSNKTEILIRSIIKSISTFPFSPYTLWSILGGLIALNYYKEPFNKIRFGIIEPSIYVIFISIFIILPKLFLRKEALLKIPKAFLYLFCFVLLIGFLDIICYYLGFNLINRTIFNFRDIGPRFHSLTNEPRDYVVCCFYYLTSLSIFFVSPITSFYFKKYFNFFLRIVIPLSILSLILAKSLVFFATFTTFLIFIFFILIIRSIISLSKFKLSKSLIIWILLGLTNLIGLIVLLNNIEFLQNIGLRRIAIYIENFDELKNYILDGNNNFQQYITENPLFLSQINSILPLLEFALPSNLFDIKSIVGNGLGSTSELLSKMLGDDFRNPHSQLTRLLYEQGILGFLFFSFIHFSTIKRSTFSIDSSLLKRRLYYIFFTILFIAFLFHRRSEYFLFIGLNYLYLKENSYNKKSV